MIKQAISFMIALNGPEKTGAWEGGDRMRGLVVFGRWTADGERRERRMSVGQRRTEKSDGNNFFFFRF